MSVTLCQKCSKPFFQEESWKRDCVACWKDSNGYTLTLSDKAFIVLQDAYVEMHDVFQVMKGRTKELEAENEELRVKLKAKPKKMGPLTPEEVKNLIRLCHPDKHKNSELANQMTKLLNSLRDS